MKEATVEMTLAPIDWRALAAPFHPDDLDWRVGNVTKNKARCTLLAYLTSRAVMDRLDEVVGPHRWMNSHEVGPGGGILCGIGVRVADGTWVWKYDGADNTAVEAVKGGLSAALKRCAVLYGIGRYLYHLDSPWFDVKQGWANGKGIDVSVGGDGHIGWVPYPRLPEWALPEGAGAPEATGKPKAEPVDKGHDAEWDEERARFFGELKTIAGINYEQVCGMLAKLPNPRPRPSHMTSKQRSTLLEWLASEAGQAALDDLLPF